MPTAGPSCNASSGNILWVGAGEAHTTLRSGIAAAQAGDTICVRAGTYVNDFATIRRDVRIIGVGGRVHLKADQGSGGRLEAGKGILVVGLPTAAPNVYIENIEFSGAKVPDRNGAGIRMQNGNLTVRNSYFHDNEDGILANDQADTDIVIEGSRFERNGFGRGSTHAIYANNVNSLTVEDSYFEATKVGHHVKSRAQTTTILNNTFEDGAGPPGQVPSYSVDITEGGVGTVEGNTFIQRDAQGNPRAINRAIVNYEYSRGNAPTYVDNDLTVQNNTFLNDAVPGRAVRNTTPVTSEVSGNTFANVQSIASGNSNQTNNVSGGFGDFAPYEPPQGSILGVQLAGDLRRLTAFDPQGGTIDGLNQPTGIAGDSGLTMLGDQLYVANRTHGIAAVDARFGTSTFYFGDSGIEALGNNGTNLLAGLFDQNLVQEYGVDGTLLNSITLQITDTLGIAGLGSNGDALFVGSYLDGDVYVFDFDGNDLGRISTGLGADALAGLAYDPFDDTLWISSLADGGELLHYDLNGTLLGSDATVGSVNGLFVNGAPVDPGPGPGPDPGPGPSPFPNPNPPGTPTVLIPEPDGLLLMLTALLGFGLLRLPSARHVGRRVQGRA